MMWIEFNEPDKDKFKDGLKKLKVKDAKSKEICDSISSVSFTELPGFVKVEDSDVDAILKVLVETIIFEIGK